MLFEVTRVLVTKGNVRVPIILNSKNVSKVEPSDRGGAGCKIIYCEDLGLPASAIYVGEEYKAVATILLSEEDE